MTRLAHYLEVYRVQLKNNWVREAVYRTNFLTTVAVDVIWMIVELSLFAVIYANVTTLAGWTRDQVYFFLGIFFATDALYTTLFQRNFWQFSDLVNKGELDILLTKPVNPLFLALSRWINLTNIVNVALGAIIAIRYAEPAGFPGGVYWLAIPCWMVVGMVTQTLLRFTFAIWIFWTERSFALSRLYYQFFQLATKPDSLYPKAIRYIILTVLPFAFISSVPTRAVLHGLEYWEYGLVAGVILMFTVVNVALWKAGLKRYQSASS